jgi:hypothetical protein
MTRPRILMTSTDMIKLMEIASIAMENRDAYDLIMREMGLSEDEMARLYHQLTGFLYGDLETA